MLIVGPFDNMMVLNDRIATNAATEPSFLAKLTCDWLWRVSWQRTVYPFFSMNARTYRENARQSTRYRA
jgi:hypothetical protein